MMEHSPQSSAVFPPHVLVMDDVPAILGLLREILEEDGYRVTTSLERLSLAQLREVSPDAIVQEYRFAGTPVLNEQYLVTLRGDSVLTHIPIILCTTCAQVTQDAALAELLGQLPVRVVRKPFDIDELLAILAETLALSREAFVGDVAAANAS